MTYSIQLDISHEATKAEVAEFAFSHNCSVALIEEFGPAGGNPLYEFTSKSYDCLLELAMQILDDEDLCIESMVEV